MSIAAKQAGVTAVTKGAGKGTRTDAVDYDEASKLFGFSAEDTKRRALAPETRAALNDIKGTPTGKFASRSAAESRAFALDRKLPKGTSIFAQQVDGHWCVIKSSPAGREIVEG